MKSKKAENRKLKEMLQNLGNTQTIKERQTYSFSDAGLCGLSKVLEAKRERRRINFFSFLMRQIRFIGWKIWLIQGMLLLALYGIFTPIAADFAMGNIRYMAYFLCCLSVLVILSAAPAFYRCVRYTMYEIELASRFSIVKLLFAKILVIGIGDVVFLAALLWMTVLNTNMQMGSALLYILFPSLVSGAGFLYLLGHVPAGKLQAGSIGWGCALFLIIFLLKQFCPFFFTQTFSAGWAAVCFVLFIFCRWQFSYLLHDSTYARVQIL